MLKTFWISLSLIIPLALLSQAEILIEGQPGYLPIIEGTHVDAYEPCVDYSGRYVAFTTSFPLVPEHERNLHIIQNEAPQLYVFDREQNVCELISIGMDGDSLRSGCCNVVMSGNGRYIGFNSGSSEFVPLNQKLYGEQCFLRDRIGIENYHISKGFDGKPANQNCHLYDITPDGRYSVFYTESTNIVKNDSNDHWDIFAYDRQYDLNRLVSISKDGIQSSGISFYPSISGNGRYIVFVTYDVKWLGETTPANQNHSAGPYQIVLKDMQNEEVEIISRKWDGTLGNGRHEGPPVISDDGRWIAFTYTSSDLIRDTPQAPSYVYLYDRLEKQMRIIAPCDEIPSFDNGNEIYITAMDITLEMSGDGRYLYWYQGENNYAQAEIFRYDRILDKIDRILYASDAPQQPVVYIGNIIGGQASANYDGRVFVYSTGSKELTPLYNQGTYQSPYTYELFTDYRVLLLSLTNPSQNGQWDWLR